MQMSSAAKVVEEWVSAHDALTALAQEGDEGRASYQVAVNVCEHCGQGTQPANGEDVAVEPAVVEMAECDARVLPTHVGERATQTIRPARRRAVMRRDGGRCVVPGCRHATFVDVHHITARADGGGDDVENLLVLCAAHHRAVHRGALVLEDLISTPQSPPPRSRTAAPR
jgi:hypothetical protein